MARFEIRVDPKSIEELQRLPEFMGNGLHGAINEFVGQAADIAVNAARGRFYSGVDWDTGFERTPFTGDSHDAIYVDLIRGVRGRDASWIAEVVADATIAPQVVFFEEDLSSEQSVFITQDSERFAQWIEEKLDTHLTPGDIGNPETGAKKRMKQIRKKRAKRPFKGRYHMAHGLRISRYFLARNRRLSATAFGYHYRVRQRAERKTEWGMPKNFGRITIDKRGREFFG